MSIYKYYAYDLKGKQLEGKMDVENVIQLKKRLKEDKLTLKSYTIEKNTNKSTSHKKLKQSELISFTREVCIMLESEISLLESLTIQETMTKSVSLKAFISNLKKSINQGEPFYTGLLPYEDQLGPTYVNLVHAGEISGTLGKTMNELADLLEKNSEIKQKINSALAYPIAVLSITVLISSFLIVFVLPSFVKMFTDSGVQLPFLTQLLLDLSSFIRGNFIVILIFIFSFVLYLKKFLATTKGKKIKNRILYRIPVFGKLILESVTLRFTRTLATLLEAGVSILKSLEIAAISVGDPLFTEKILKVKEEVQSGISISSSLNRTNYFSIATISMINVGEKSGRTVIILKKLASTNEKHFDQFVKGAITLIEPLIMIFMGVMIGSVVLALYLPMFDMISAVK
ncbi:MAG: type II secretion system F family protein [Fusobacteriaceae bacterium]